MTIKLPTLEELFKAGVHFGHQKYRSAAGARKYVFQVRDGVMIFDLEQTVTALKQATDFLKERLAEGELVLLVGTKRQFRDVVASYGKKLKIPYVAQRWPGGMLTNFETVRRQIARYNELLDQAEGEVGKTLTKKERRVVLKHLERMGKVFEGVRNLDRLPDLLLVIGVTSERTAVAEAAKLAIPTVALIDSDANPDFITFPVPANDDSRASIELILKVFAQAIEQGREENEKTEDRRQKMEMKTEDRKRSKGDDQKNQKAKG